MKIDEVTKELMRQRIKAARALVKEALAELDRANRLIYDVEERMLDMEDEELCISSPNEFLGMRRI